MTFRVLSEPIKRWRGRRDLPIPTSQRIETSVSTSTLICCTYFAILKVKQLFFSLRGASGATEEMSGLGERFKIRVRQKRGSMLLSHSQSRQNASRGPRYWMSLLPQFGQTSILRDSSRFSSEWKMFRWYNFISPSYRCPSGQRTLFAAPDSSRSIISRRNGIRLPQAGHRSG